MIKAILKLIKFLCDDGNEEADKKFQDFIQTRIQAKKLELENEQLKKNNVKLLKLYQNEKYLRAHKI